jgi:chloramphenicol 3-O-phosphotransferase
MTLGEYRKRSPRQQYLYDLHRIVTHSNLPIQKTPMSEAVAQVMRRRITANASKSTERTRPGLMINGGGQQGKTETACECAAAFEDDWLETVGYLNPDAVPGTRDLLAPVAYVRTPVNARPSTMSEAILDFYGEDYKGMKPAVLIRTVKQALKDHATKVLILDDVTRLKMHREADQDVLDFIRDLMSFTVLVLVGVGIPKSGLLREGRIDPRTGDWVFPPIRDKGKSPNDEAATQTERRFALVNLESFSYDTPASTAAWVAHLSGIEGQLRLLDAGPEPLTGGTMPEYLFRRTGGIVGRLSNLLEEACVAAMETGTEALPEHLLEEIVIGTDTGPAGDSATEEAPARPGEPTAPSASTGRRKSRNTVFDDRGDASPSRA